MIDMAYCNKENFMTIECERPAGTNCLVCADVRHKFARNMFTDILAHICSTTVKTKINLQCIHDICLL